jgi:hypothetical protein
VRQVCGDLADMRFHHPPTRGSAPWRQFGSSSYVHQPNGSVLQHFVRRSPLLGESVSGEILCDQACVLQQNKYANEHNLNPPFGRGKPLVPFRWASLCAHHSCAAGDCATWRGPQNLSLWINHYAYQSEEHWERKKARGRTGLNAMPRLGPVPKWYDSVLDEEGWVVLQARIAALRGDALRSCVDHLFSESGEVDV